MDGGGGASMEVISEGEDLRQSYRVSRKGTGKRCAFPLLSAPCPPPQPWRPGPPTPGGAAEKEGPERGTETGLLRSARYLESCDGD